MSQTVLERPQTDVTEGAVRKFPPLTAHDRCDAATVKMVGGVAVKGSCRAQAFVRVVLPSGLDLVFCGHCAGEQTIDKNALNTKAWVLAMRRQALIALGAEFLSEYETINLKPTSASEAVGF